MSSVILNDKEIKKNYLSQNNPSNKQISIKKDENIKKEELIHNDKINLKKNFITNTSVKKINKVTKISINDIGKRVPLKTKKKLDTSNKENHIINQKEKKITKNSNQKLILKKIVNEAKIQIKQNFPKVKKNLKSNMLYKNNLKIHSNNSDYIMENSPNKKESINEETKKNNKIIKSKENSVSPKNTNIIKNEKNEKNLINHNLLRKEIIKQNTLRYKKKNMSEKKNINSEDFNKDLEPLIKMKKEHIKYSMERKREKQKINIENKRLSFEGENQNNNSSYFNNCNSNNDEIENKNNYINIINNFDIINIINLKEKTKKLSSIQDNLSLNYTRVSKGKKILKQYNTSKSSNNKLNSILTNKSNENIIELKVNNNSNETDIPISVRNINYSNYDISLLNSEKGKDNNSSTEKNHDMIQSKWDNKFFIPIISASLVNNGEETKKEKMKCYIKINNNNTSFSGHMNNINKKSVNFGDNNKKKREMLFNFSNKKFKNDSYKYINFHSKRTNSFILKRNQHITERNNSLNMMSENYNSNLDFDLNQQEKKLELLKNEISQEKKKGELNKSNICAISVDNISDYSFDKNNKNKEELMNLKDKKINAKQCKTFHIKVNSFNAIKKVNNINNNNMIKNNGEKMIVKRGDLLKRLRNIKHNYSEM